MPTFPISLSSLLIAPSPHARWDWDMERIGASKQWKEPLGDTFARGMEGISRLYKHSTSVNTLIQIVSYRSSQSAHTLYNIRHTVIIQSYTLVYYIIYLLNIRVYHIFRIHYPKPLSDGSKKPNERTIGTARTSHTPLCPYSFLRKKSPTSRFFLSRFTRILR